MPTDILDAICAYLAGAMGQSLASPTGYAQVYADYCPSANPDGSTVTPPYAMVTEGPETYSAQSEDPETGFMLSNLADGRALVSFFAPTKSDARALCRQAARLMSDTRVQLGADDGRVVTLLPIRSTTVPRDEAGIGDQPALFLRVLEVQYVQQFLE